MVRWSPYRIIPAAAFLAVLSLALLIALPPTALADGPGDWPMFRHDPAHTGYNPDETQLQPPLQLKWSYTTGGQVESSPAAASGVVYVGSGDRKLYALDAATGALKWSYAMGDIRYSYKRFASVRILYQR